MDMYQKREMRKNKKMNEDTKSLPSTSINWYPGHMVKTKRQIKENIDLIDIVYEVIDARIPKSSKNKDIDYMIKNADRKTAGFLEKMKKNNPWQIAEPYMEEDINCFWMEFYFTGKSEPILKVANQLRNRPIISPGQLKNKKGELTVAEKSKLRNYYSASSAAWSLSTNTSQHNLVFFYLEYMLENGKFADTTAASKIQKTLVRASADVAATK